jgi:hypothetical protein
MPGEGNPSRQRKMVVHFPEIRMSCLTDGNIFHECNVCFGLTPSVAFSSQIQFRNNTDQSQDVNKNIERPGHSTFSVQVEWVNKFHNWFHHVEFWRGFIKTRVTSHPVK